MSEASTVIDLKTHQDVVTHVVEGGKPALIDFWAPWCGPCKATAPAFEAAARAQGERVTFCKVNTEDAPDLAAAFGIRSIPTLAMMIGGKVVDVHVGASRQADIEAMALRLADRFEKQQHGGPGLLARVKSLFF